MDRKSSTDINSMMLKCVLDLNLNTNIKKPDQAHQDTPTNDAKNKKVSMASMMTSPPQQKTNIQLMNQSSISNKSQIEIDSLPIWCSDRYAPLLYKQIYEASLNK
jgi:hypothetical protein